jgi:hypothetical protein
MDARADFTNQLPGFEVSPPTLIFEKDNAAVHRKKKRKHRILKTKGTPFIS